MRLTLRTLLALRDGLLQGAERDDLATKVAASTVAPRLLERIAELGGRADLPAPDGEANTVAEFLDNVLAGEQLESFERSCLESEPRMAEAAECHTLLSELVRDAAVSPPLDPTTIERILEVTRRQEPLSGEAPLPDEALDIGDIMREAKAAASRRGADSARQSSRATRGAWLSAGTAIVLLLILGGLLVRSLWSPSPRARQVAGDERLAIAPAMPVPEAAVEVPAPHERAEPAAPEPAPDPIEAAAVASVEVHEPDPSTDAGGPRASQVVPPSSETTSAFPPQTEEPVIPLPEMEADEPEPAASVTDPKPSVASQPQGGGLEAPQIVSGGPLLHRVMTGNDSAWRAVSSGSKLANTEEFIVPAYSYPQIVRGNLSLRLLPRTRGAMSVDRDGTFRIEIVFGQAVMWSEVANASVGITVGGLSGLFSLGARQPVGIDVELTRVPGTDPAIVPPGMRVLVVAGGGGRFRQTERDGGVPGSPLAGLELEQPLPPRGGILWDATAPGAARVVPIPQEPSWLKLVGPVRIVDRHAAEAMTAALGADVPAEAALRMMAESRRVEERMAAAASLALLGDFDLLVESLCQESPDRQLREGEWTALEATTVPLALARGANAATALRQSFARKGPPGRADELFLLARGLSSDELSAGGAEGLVTALEDRSLVVRRYALKNLLALLPDPSEATRDYRPDRAVLLNDKGITWWQGRLAEGLGGGKGDPTKSP